MFVRPGAWALGAGNAWVVQGTTQSPKPHLFADVVELPLQVLAPAVALRVALQRLVLCLQLGQLALLRSQALQSVCVWGGRPG